MPNRTKDLAGLFSSEPLVAAAWDGRPAFRLAESVAESEDRSAADGARSAATSAFTPATRSRRRSSRDLLAAKLKIVRAGDRRRSWRSTITGWCCACTSRHRCKARRSEHADRRQQRRGARSASAPARSSSPPPSRRCSSRSTSTTMGQPAVQRVEIAGVPDSSGGVDRHDAPRGEFPARGQPRRHRLRRSRRRHSRLPAAAAVLHRAGLQHGPPGAAAPRSAGRDQRGDRSQRAGSERHARARARLPRARSGPITGPIRRAGSRSRSTPRRRSCGSRRRA